MMNPDEKRRLLDIDRQVVWHPFTQMKDYETLDPLLIEKAEGLFLYDADGRRYYDTASSWWVNVHGHGHPRLGEAMNRQFAAIDHVMFGGTTHRPVIELAKRLVELAPPGLTKVFYSDNGSTAVEVALKMSFQYWQQTGKPGKTKFAFLDHSYHGDTIGAVSVGGVNNFHSLFQPLMFAAYRMTAPRIARGVEHTEAAWAEAVEEALADARRRLEESADELAAVIVEPMIQAAGGMNIYPASYLRGLSELCRAFQVHLIADEVAVGFGRTGRMFACEHAGVTPDFMCLSKGLTGGTLPMGATLCNDEIYMAFYDDYETLKLFTHGHSYTGNPVISAVALESLKMLEEERSLERVAKAAPVLAEAAQRIAQHPHVANPRSLGMIAGFDLVLDKHSGAEFESRFRAGHRLYLAGLEEGLLLRPLGDTFYFWLPLCTTEEQIEDIAERTLRALDRVSWPKG